MDDAQFWQLIADSRKAGDGQADALQGALAQLPADDIVEFDKLFDRYMAGLYRWDLWAAAYIIQGGASDDGFDYFCAWIIGQGETTYKSAVNDARAYGHAIELSDGDFDGEDLMYAASKAYESVAGGPLPEHHSIRPKDPLGEPWDESEVESRYPKLAARWATYRATGIKRGGGGGPLAFLKKLFFRS
jgi:hypothetical protein